MNRLPQHKASQYSELGMVFHHFSSHDISHAPVCYAHQDDYYIFGFLAHGAACGIIDFILTYIIHTCFYCKGKLVAPQHDARSSSLKVGFTTFCIVIAQARTDAQPFYLFVTKQYE